MALNANALTTVANLQAWLAQDTIATATDGRYATARCEALINRVSSHIEAYCDRMLIAPAAAYTYTLDGDGGTMIPLYREGAWPIVAVTSVTDSATSEVIAARTSIYGTGYTMNAAIGVINLHGYSTTPGVQTIAVVARAGYDATTAALATVLGRLHRRALDDLENACLQLCSLLWHSPVPSAESVQIAGTGMAIRESAMPSRIRLMLDPYRRLTL